MNLRIVGAGSIDNMPQSGQHNTLWKIEAGALNPWEPVLEETRSILPAGDEDLCILEIEVTNGAPRDSCRAAFWRADP